jgi:hypothetical protein
MRTLYGLVLSTLMITASGGGQNAVTQNAGSASVDTAEVLSVVPAVDVPLRSGKKTEFVVKIRYSLHSVDRAILAVYAERFPKTADQCGLPSGHQTEGGKSVAVKRGVAEVEVKFNWLEYTGSESKIPRGAAYVGIGMNLWTERRGKPVKPVVQMFTVGSCHEVLP